MVLMVVADAKSRIVYAHFGSYGHEGDAGIFDRSDFSRLIRDPANPLNLPAATQLPGTDVECPHFFLGDGAFPLLDCMMKPFGQARMTRENRVFNYRQSRARRVVESTFGIMCAKWRLLLKPIECGPERVDTIVKAICCLHNFLIEQGEAGQNIPEEDIQAASVLRQAQMRPAMANRAAQGAEEVRQRLVEFVNGAGALDFQDDYA